VAHAIVGIGHEAGYLLVVGGDGLDAVASVEGDVEKADDAVAADAEQVGHLLLEQVFDDDLGALKTWHL